MSADENKMREYDSFGEEWKMLRTYVSQTTIMDKRQWPLCKWRNYRQ